MESSKGFNIVSSWMASNGRQPFSFQKETWRQILSGNSGLVNAPTGCGKTYSVFLGAVIDFINRNGPAYAKKKNNGLQLLWITPLRALATDIARAMEEVISALGMQWSVGIRNGDTDLAERAKQKRQMPEVLIITPESLHLLLAQKSYPEYFSKLKIVAVDEWHELLGSKRGVQVELALSRIVSLASIKLDTNLESSISSLQVWGISATIGNLEQSREILLRPLCKTEAALSKTIIVKADIKKRIAVESVFPDEIEKFPWAGHLGIKLASKVLPIIENSRTTLIFINTRGMSETWYQTLLNLEPELAGFIALHHGSIDRELRSWIEENLHSGKLKAVVCTASLDLGVDFRPVETVIQVGSPKGVARFLQRAGRSGHSPDAVSRIYFLPTHSLELMEAAALKAAMKEELIESRQPMMLCYDVLLQFLNTLAISEGFTSAMTFEEIRSTHCYQDLSIEEWEEILHFLTSGGTAMNQYDEFRKVEVEDGVFRIRSRRVAMRHRMHIGTIVSDAMLKVRFISGGYVGMIEEYFISRLEAGDVFTLAGRNLEFVMIKDMTVLVRSSTKKKSMVPSWNGGRMPLSANLGKKLRETLNSAGKKDSAIEMEKLKPLFELQRKLSVIPKQNELLIEQIETEDGFHLFVYPFEGRLVHEAMAAILAFRLSRITPITFSFAMNDYGFELLSDQPIPLDDTNVYELFSPDNLLADIQRSVNSTEMARRKFRDIAVIGGLIFPGMPGERKKPRHLQASASLLFNVFSEYDPHNLLLRQAYREVLDQQMEEVRLRDMLERIQRSKIVLTFPEKLTPFCFPVKVDSMREDLSSEKLEDRVRRMQQELERE
jgi:ATP-dependent Lhr-like helicase